MYMDNDALNRYLEDIINEVDSLSKSVAFVLIELEAMRKRLKQVKEELKKIQESTK